MYSTVWNILSVAGTSVSFLIMAIFLGFAIEELVTRYRNGWKRRKWIQQRQNLLESLSEINRWCGSLPQVVETARYIQSIVLYDRRPLISAWRDLVTDAEFAKDQEQQALLARLRTALTHYLVSSKSGCLPGTDALPDPSQTLWFCAGCGGRDANGDQAPINRGLRPQHWQSCVLYVRPDNE